MTIVCYNRYNRLIVKRRWIWTERISRMIHNRLLKIVTDSNPTTGKAKIGRSEKSWCKSP